VTEKLTAMQTPERVIEIKLEPTIQSLSGAVDRFSAQAEHQIAGLQTILAAVQENTNASTNILTSVRDGNTANSEEMRQLVKQIRSATFEVLNAVTLMREGGQNYERLTQQALAAARQLVEQMTGSAASFKIDVTGHLEQVQAILDDREQRLEHWAQTLTQIVSQQKTTLADLAGTLAQFNRIAELIARQVVAGSQEAPVSMPVMPGHAA
jgi:hypothetical protein